MGMYIYHATPLTNMESISQSGFLYRSIFAEGEEYFDMKNSTRKELKVISQPYGPIYDGVYFAESVEDAWRFIAGRNPSLDLYNYAFIRLRKDILRKHYGKALKRSYDHLGEFFPYKAYVVWDDVDLRKTKAKVVSYQS